MLLSHVKLAEFFVNNAGSVSPHSVVYIEVGNIVDL